MEVAQEIYAPSFLCFSTCSNHLLLIRPSFVLIVEKIAFPQRMRDAFSEFDVLCCHQFTNDNEVMLIQAILNLFVKTLF